MANLVINNNLEELSRSLSEIDGAKTSRAIARAINRTARTVNKNNRKAIREKFTLKAKNINKSLKISKATASDLFAEINYSGKKIGLHNYKHSPKTRTKKRKKIVSTVEKGNPVTLDHAFIGKGKILERTTENAYPIKMLTGPSVPELAQNEQIQITTQDTINELLNKNLTNEFNFLVSQL